MARSDAKVDTGYRFIDKDPMIDVVRDAMRTTGFDGDKIQERRGPTAQTIRAWDVGKTRKPQALSLVYAMRAMGYDQVWRNGKSELSVSYPDPARVRGSPKAKRPVKRRKKS